MRTFWYPEIKKRLNRVPFPARAELRLLPERLPAVIFLTGPETPLVGGPSLRS